MKFAVTLLVSVLSLFVSSASAASFESNIQRIGVNPVSGLLIITLDKETANTGNCFRSNQLAWSMDEKSTSAILSTLLSAYHTEKKVQFDASPAATCLGEYQSGGSVFLER